MKYYDLYEPIIKLFEKGIIDIGIHAGYLTLSNGIIPMPSPKSLAKYEESDISDEALDNYEREVF